MHTNILFIYNFRKKTVKVIDYIVQMQSQGSDLS